CKRWVLPRPTVECTYSGQKADVPPRLRLATRCTALKASSFDRPTWKVAKVSRRSRGDPVKASPTAIVAGVRLGARRSATRSTGVSRGLGAVFSGAAQSGGRLLV